MTNRAVWDVRQRTQGTVQEKLIRQDDWRIPVMEALNDLVHAPREKFEELTILQL